MQFRTPLFWSMRTESFSQPIKARVAARNGLYLEQDRLRIRDRMAERHLLRNLKGIDLAQRFNLEAPPGSALWVPRVSDASNWLLQMLPAEKKMAGTAVIFISTSAAKNGATESDLADLFDLSPMQRQIALRLFEGQRPNEVGDQLGITRNTFKTHVRRLFLKVGVSRQTEVVRLLSNLKPRR
jgi:DNA-binding CsgD family transcriptional regulator